MRTLLLIFFIITITDSSAQEEYRYLLDRMSILKETDRSLSSSNASLLGWKNSVDISRAEVGGAYENGLLRNYNQAKSLLGASASVESYKRIGSGSILWGKISWSGSTGRNMGGSAFINPEMKPFDIVEDSLGNEGKKHLETISICGALGQRVSDRLSLGARICYDVASYAKYRDLRHQNSFMDFRLDLSASLRLDRITAGISLFIEPSVESLDFGVYGTTEKVYKSLVSFGCMTGEVDTYGGYGFMDSNATLPLYDGRKGIALQAMASISPSLSWFATVEYASRNGYYGKKSPSTIQYETHDGNSLIASATLKLDLGEDTHMVDIKTSAGKVTGYRTSYMRVTDEQTSSTSYEYYEPVCAGSKATKGILLAYKGLFGVRNGMPLWRLGAGIDITSRTERSVSYPFERTQDITCIRPYAMAARNISLGEDNIGITAMLSFQKGFGDIYKDKELAGYSPGQSRPEEMEQYLHMEYGYLTEASILAGIGLTYSHAMGSKGLTAYIRTDSSFRRMLKMSEYMEGRTRIFSSLTLGCTF